MRKSLLPTELLLIVSLQFALSTRNPATPNLRTISSPANRMDKCASGVCGVGGGTEPTSVARGKASKATGGNHIVVDVYSDPACPWLVFVVETWAVRAVFL